MKRGASFENDNERQLKQRRIQSQPEEILAPIHNPIEAGLALYKHANNGNSFAVGTVLHAYRHHIGYGYKGWSLIKASQCGFNDVVSLLLQYSAQDISPKQITDAYQLASNTDTQQIIHPYVKKP